MSQCPSGETIVGFHGGFPIRQVGVWRVSGVLRRVRNLQPRYYGYRPIFRGWMSALRFLSPPAPMPLSLKLSILVIFNIL